MEVLVVIAIIAVLIAIAIPVFAGQVERAKIATDQANVRSAKAAAVAEFLTTGSSEEQRYYFNAGTGSVQADSNGISGYGQYTSNDKEDEIGASGTPNRDGTPAFLTLLVSSDGQVEASWGSVFGKLWKNVAYALTPRSGALKTDGTGATLRQEVTQIPNENRIKADTDAVESIASYFVGMTKSQLYQALNSNANSWDMDTKINNDFSLFKYYV